MHRITTVAAHLASDVESILNTGESLRREQRGIGIRLRILLDLTEHCAGAVRQARLKILKALGRTELGDQLRRRGG